MNTVAANTEKRRGRPRTFDPESAAAAAQRLFARDGYDGVSIAQLCDLLGIRPPSLYAAWGSKRALFDAVLDRYSATSTAAYRAALARADSLPAMRRAVLRAAVEIYAGGVGCLVLSNLTATADADLRAALARVLDDRRAAMIARAEELGATPEEARAEVTAISVAMMGLSAAARTGMDRDALLAVSDRLA